MPGRQVPALARQRCQLRREAGLLPASSGYFLTRADTPGQQVPPLARQRRQLHREARLLRVALTIPAGQGAQAASQQQQAGKHARLCSTNIAGTAGTTWLNQPRTWHIPRAPAPLPAPTTLQPFS